jgi:Cu-Zn family superoxide dismutase
VKFRILLLCAIGGAACYSPQPWPSPESTQTPPATAAPARTPARAAPPAPFEAWLASAVIRDLAGRAVGTVNFTDTRAGLLLSGDVKGLGLGPHGIHIHEVGKCEAPFTEAGGHFNPTSHKHGFKSPDGYHLGDLPDIDVPAADRLHFDFLVPNVSLRGKNALLDGDGASIVIHGAKDDYITDPSGGSGGRIACGVITIK